MQLKMGPLIRGESDPRLYHNLFKRRENQIGRFSGAILRYITRTVPEPESLQLEASGWQARRALTTFRGEADHFKRLNGWDEFLLSEIRMITKEMWLKRADQAGDIQVGVHVRRGDFATAANSGEFKTRGGLRTPLSWFVHTLGLIRNIAGRTVAGCVFSDGTFEELADLLTLDKTYLIRTGSAIGDLLALSRSKILVATGGSTFSAWASFFGQMPTLTYPGQSLAWYNLTNRKGRYVGDFDPYAHQSSDILEELKLAAQNC